MSAGHVFALELRPGNVEQSSILEYSQSIDMKALGLRKTIFVLPYDSKKLIELSTSPNTVERLTLPSLKLDVIDSLVDLIEKKGHSLTYLCIKLQEIYPYSEAVAARVRRLYQVIGNKCVKLRKLHMWMIETSTHHLSDLRGMLIKRGSQLTALYINDSLPDSGILELIASKCKKLKYLYLSLEMSEDDSVEAYDKLKSIYSLKLCKIDFFET
ncbi:hypothetical protein HDE_10348 [Halotydeus destructor]|nr:hypothetical protein HDE_10348 [Halotydeus destructor]